MYAKMRDHINRQNGQTHSNDSSAYTSFVSKPHFEEVGASRVNPLMTNGALI